MKIAIVNEFVDPRRGGAETSIGQMAAGLAESGAEVWVLASDEGPLAVHPGLNLVTIKPARGPRWLQTLGFLGAVRKWCAARKIDIVHAVTPYDACDVYQPRGGTYRATIDHGLAAVANPLVRSAKRVGRWFNVRQQLLARIERRMLQAAQPPHVAAVSELVTQQIRSIAPRFPSERLHVVFNACRVERDRDWTPAGQNAARQTLGLPRDRSIILFVAHNFRLKGLPELIAALREPALHESGAEIAVIGRDRVATMAAIARRTGVEARIRFIGPTTSMSCWYAAADVLAHPTWYDPCSRVVLEALCHGLPVVTTRCNGAAEIVTAGTGRVVASPRNTRLLADAIVQCLTPEMRRNAAGESSIMRERLSMSRHVAELLGLYAQILPARGRETPLTRNRFSANDLA